jgi:hypothetical protein
MEEYDARLTELDRRIKEAQAKLEPRVVDNRTFLLGLDKLYREAMKKHERTELRECARRVAEVLGIEPVNVPVEGYYSDEADLTEYFLLMRALHDVSDKAEPSVRTLSEFNRLAAVTSSPVFGRATPNGRLLPTGIDPLTQALNDTQPRWTVAGLTQAAHDIAIRWNDFSLVGLAARIRDSVVLAAMRESVVLYARRGVGAAFPLEPRYIWEVDDDLTRLARRFIDTFNALLGDELPPADAEHAEEFWHACGRNKILGRCVRVGYEDRVTPTQHYHWGIRLSGSGTLEVEDFWSPEIWTTERYRSAKQWTGDT